MSQQSSIEIVRFAKSEHLQESVNGIMEVNKSGEKYPPLHNAEPTTAFLSSWLMEENAVNRWVAVLDGNVAGHISTVKAHPYLTGHLKNVGVEFLNKKGVAEISKFFVNPLYQKHGAGKRLFAHAIDVSKHEGYAVALAVISTSTDAIRFYQKAGLVGTGYFDGLDGRNYVFISE